MLDPDRIVGALPGLYRYALALTRSPEAADDLVQDTVVKALAKADTFRGDSSADTWLHRILHHTYLDSRKARGAEPTADERLLAAVDAAWADDDYTVSPEGVLLRAQTRESLLDALVRLPYDHRAAVILHDVEGHTAAQVATILEISLAAAKQRIRRGRAMLVSALDGEVERRLALKGVPMKCFDARSLVSDYLDNELDAGRRTALEEHLAACPTCPSLFAALVGVTDALGGLRDAATVVPPRLADRLRRHLNPTDS